MQVPEEGTYIVTQEGFMEEVTLELCQRGYVRVTWLRRLVMVGSFSASRETACKMKQSKEKNILHLECQ